MTPSTPLVRYVAFLRAINVGGRRVKMDELRGLFEAMGFANVATFIASGNVLFEAPSEARAALEARVAAALQAALGYQVDTFVRTLAEVEAIAAATPFAPDAMARDEATVHVGFLAEPPPDARALEGYTTETDSFALQGREAYWLCRTRMSDSAFSGALLEKALGQPATLRSLSTVRRIAAKFG